MAEAVISINGRQYNIACDPGQEQRVQDLAAFVDSRLKQIAQAGGGSSDAHLLVLTSLIMADELFETRDKASTTGGVPRAPIDGIQITKEQEGQIVDALDKMATRINALSGSLQKMA